MIQYFLEILRKIIVVNLLIIIVVFGNGNRISFRKLLIVSQNDTETYSTNKNQIYAFRENITLNLILKARIENMYSSVFFSEVDDIILDEDTVYNKKIISWENYNSQNIVIKWYKIVPVNLDTVYFNNYNSLLPWANIEYEEILIEEWQNKWQVSLDSIKSYDEIFPGTMRFKAEIAFLGEFAETPGIASRTIVSGDYYSGLNEDVFRVGILGNSGNSFADYLCLFRNIPFIQNCGSWNNSWEEHQTVKWIGVNNKAAIIRAAELAGRNLHKYFDKLPIPQYNNFELTDYYYYPVIRKNDFYYTRNNKLVNLNEFLFNAGDFIIYRDNLCVFLNDKSPVNSIHKGLSNNLLDNQDEVIFTDKSSWNFEKINKAIGDSLVLIRWKKRW